MISISARQMISADVTMSPSETPCIRNCRLCMVRSVYNTSFTVDITMVLRVLEGPRASRGNVASITSTLEARLRGGVAIKDLRTRTLLVLPNERAGELPRRWRGKAAWTRKANARNACGAHGKTRSRNHARQPAQHQQVVEDVASSSNSYWRRRRLGRLRLSPCPLFFQWFSSFAFTASPSEPGMVRSAACWKA